MARAAAVSEIDFWIVDCSCGFKGDVSEAIYRFEDETVLLGAPMPGIARPTFFNDQKGYGFIATEDGQEIFSHQNSVVEIGFEALEVGRAVRLVVIEGESADGPQAMTVSPIPELKLQVSH